VFDMIWVIAALVVAAVLSAVFTLSVRSKVRRRWKASQLLDALAHYSGWVEAQRRLAFFASEEEEIEPQLRQLRAYRQLGFDELEAEFGQLLALHQRIVEFLRKQHLQRVDDPEAWLEVDHQAVFMDLWRQQRAAILAAAVKLQRTVGIPEAELETGIFPA
jgi:hypothetical protein